MPVLVQVPVQVPVPVRVLVHPSAPESPVAPEIRGSERERERGVRGRGAFEATTRAAIDPGNWQ